MNDFDFDYLLDLALGAGVPVDGLESFAKETPSCTECGSYELSEVTTTRGKKEYHAPVYTLYFVCRGCGCKVRDPCDKDIVNEF